MKSVTKTAPKTEVFSVRLDAETARRLRFCAEEEGFTPEAFAAKAVVQCVIGTMTAGLDVDDDQLPAEALVTKLNTPRAA